MSSVMRWLARQATRDASGFQVNRATVQNTYRRECHVYLWPRARSRSREPGPVSGALDRPARRAALPEDGCGEVVVIPKLGDAAYVTALSPSQRCCRREG
jgi:hypothetical protein